MKCNKFMLHAIYSTCIGIGVFMNKISVSIVTYNNSDIILKAVESILSNSMDVQVYISDNGSTDSTVSKIKKAFGNNQIVSVIENGKNLGYGVGNNQVLKHLDSEYHAIINPDIEIRDDVLGKMAKYMDRNPDVAVLSPRIFFPNGGEQLLPKRYPSISALAERRLPVTFHKSADNYIMLDKDLTKNQHLEVATGCFLFTRTKLLEKVGGFDPRYFMYFEDYDLSLKLAQFGKILYNPDFIVYHDWERSGMKSIKYMLIQISSMIKFFNKWGWKF